MIVALGNRDAAVAQVGEDGSKKMQSLSKGKRATVINFPDDWSMAQCFRALTDGDGVMNNHFADGASPAWVASDNEALADLISENFDGIEVRALELEGGVVPGDENVKGSKK